LISLLFDFYSAAAVQVNTELPAAADFFANEYAFHRVDNMHPDEPCVVLNFYKEPPALSQWVNHTHKFLARWSYAIELADERVVLDAVGNSWAIPMVHHMIVHAGLRYLISFQDRMLLHSGGVAMNGRSLLFTGRGGSGKTTITSLLLSDPSRQWALHADDYAFLQPGGGTQAYLTRAHIYRDLLKWVPDLHERLSWRERAQVEVYGRIRSWSGDRIKWPVRMALDRLWPGKNFCRQAGQSALILLQRGDVAEPRLSVIQPDSTVVDSLMEMNFYEARHFQNLLRKYLSPLRADPLIAAWYVREKDILGRWILQVPLYELLLPTRHFARNELTSQLVDLLLPLVQAENGVGIG